MPEILTPPSLQPGDHVRVVAPATSLGVLNADSRYHADKRFAEDLQLEVSFGDNTNEPPNYENSSSVQGRVEDLHAAFADPNVKAIFTVLGGYNSNQLLPYLDWDLIRSNPTILCGFSDITALQNAILARSGLITYYGPHYSTLGQKHLDPYTLDSLKTSLFGTETYNIEPSAQWTDDLWFINQDDRRPHTNEGPWVIQPGTASGTIIGGNGCTLQLLQGTDNMPHPDKPILFTEDIASMTPGYFDRHLTAFLQSRAGQSLGGLVVGRFQAETNMTREELARVIASKPELAQLPVIANLDFGHTEPRATFPIGGEVQLHANTDHPRVTIQR